MSYIVAIDQGTTSTRSILFDQNMKAINSSQIEFKQFHEVLLFPPPLFVHAKRQSSIDTNCAFSEETQELFIQL